MNQDRQQAYQTARRKTGFVVLLLVAAGISSFADDSVPCRSYDRPFSIATIRDDRLIEISGLVISRSQPEILWVHNDSGDDAKVYAIDLQGRMLVEVQLVDQTGTVIDAVDCEDIALGPGSDDSSFLYLADIGDNAARRETVRIYRFPEPQIVIREDEPIVQMMAVCDVIEVAYPDGPRDAETLLVDPITGDMVIVSKDFIHARAYRVEDSVGGASTLEFLVELPWGFMTGGDMSPDGLSILLRSYWNAGVWPRSSEGDWWMSLASPGCPAILAVEQQGEAIGFSADGLGYLTISEGTQPFLYSYRIQAEDIAD